MNIDQIKKVQKIEGVDVFDIQERDEKTVLKLYPAKATDETKTIVLDNGDEEPINVSDVPVRSGKALDVSDEKMQEMSDNYKSDEELVWTALKKKVGGVLG